VHYHLEVIFSPDLGDPKTVIAEVMKPFDENDDENRRSGFWDWYVIGGRWAGTKRLRRYDAKKLDEFNDWCKEAKITVSGLTAGKQELSPASQIPVVDAKWKEMFGDDKCILFKHANDQYSPASTIDGDVSRLADSLDVKCSRVIFCGRSHAGTDGKWIGGPEAKFMLAESQWNGVNHMPIRWDGTIGDTLEQFQKGIENYSDEYREAMTPKGEWLCVTVDYHS
jgi:hypothetical protein